jgi:hypothetical protein
MLHRRSRSDRISGWLAVLGTVAGLLSTSNGVGIITIAKADTTTLTGTVRDFNDSTPTLRVRTVVSPRGLSEPF